MQSETNYTLIEIKNNLQGNNSSMDEAKIKSMIWNIRKQKTANQNKKKKKESKKMRIVQTASRTTLRGPSFTS